MRRRVGVVGDGLGRMRPGAAEGHIAEGEAAREFRRGHGREQPRRIAEGQRRPSGIRRKSKLPLRIGEGLRVFIPLRDGIERALAA